MICLPFLLLGDGTFSFEEFVQVMANVGGISENSVEDEEEELRQAFRVSTTFSGMGSCFQIAVSIRLSIIILPWSCSCACPLCCCCCCSSCFVLLDVVAVVVLVVILFLVVVVAVFVLLLLVVLVDVVIVVMIVVPVLYRCYFFGVGVLVVAAVLLWSSV